MMFAAACGGSDDAKTPVADPPAAEALSQAEFAPKVKDAVGQKSTFHVVITTTDEDGPVTFASDVKVAPTVTDLSGTGAGGSADRREVLRQG